MLDFIVAIFIIGSAMSAYSKGLIKTIYQLISWIGSIILAFTFYPIVKSVLQMSPLYKIIQNTIMAIIGTSPIGEGVQTQAEAIRSITGGLPEFISEGLIANNNPTVYEILGVSSVGEYISVYAANLLITIIAFMMTWLIIKLLFGMFTPLMEWLSKISAITGLNKWLGFLFGGTKAVIMVWVVLLMVPVVALIPSFRVILEQINESTLTHFLYSNNLILHYLNRIFII